MHREWITAGVRRQARPVLAVAVFGALAAMTGLSGGAAAATTSSSSGTTSSSAAVVTPLLELFEFGDTFGFPLMCADAGSVVSIIGAQTHAAAVSPLVVDLNRQCTQLSAEGSVALERAISESQALSLINPAVNPLIAGLSNGLTDVGNQYGPSLAPFGPTVAGLGGTVAFFEGT